MKLFVNKKNMIQK